MKKLLKKEVLIVLIMLIAILILPNNIYANNLDVAMVKIQDDIIIYIKGMENKEFKFAFTNNETLTEDNVAQTLNFVQNWEDTNLSNTKNVACLEKNMGLDETQPIYMWIEKEDGTYSSVLLNLNDAINKDDVENLEKLTKIIAVDTKESKKTVTNENGVTVTSTVGEIDITDNKECTYKYYMIKLDGTESETTKSLTEIINSMKNENDSMYDKIVKISKTNKSLKELLENAVWKDVENMVIYQPEDSKNGDRYMVLLQQLSNNKVVKEDIQLMVCTDGHEEEFVKEVKEVKKATALPVTYDSLVLLIILAVILIIAIAVFVRIKKLKKGNHAK